MKERFPPAIDRMNAVEGTPEREMETLLFTHPEFEGLEPYYIDWEFIWPM